MEISAIARCDQVVSSVIFRQYTLGIKVSFTYFQSKKDCLKKLKIVNKCFRQSSSAEIVEALFKIAHMIAKEKLYNIGETLIKPSMSKAAGLVLGKTYNKKMAKISLSDFTIKTTIDELAKDMECQVLKKLQASPFV